MNIITEPDFFIPTLFAVVVLALFCWLLHSQDKNGWQVRHNRIENLKKVVPDKPWTFLIYVEDLSIQTGYDQDKLISWYCQFSLASGNHFVQMQKWDMFETFIKVFKKFGDVDYEVNKGISSLCQMLAMGSIGRVDFWQLSAVVPKLVVAMEMVVSTDRSAILYGINKGRFDSNIIIPELAKYYKKTILKDHK